jgi:hypothetical protein
MPMSLTHFALLSSCFAAFLIMANHGEGTYLRVVCHGWFVVYQIALHAATQCMLSHSA